MWMHGSFQSSVRRETCRQLPLLLQCPSLSGLRLSRVLAGDRDTLDNVACKRSNCETACKNNYREELFHNCSVFAAVPACFHQLRTRIPNLTSGAPLSSMVFTFRIRAGQM